MAGHTMHSIQVQKEVVTDGGAENQSVDAKYVVDDDVYGHKAV